MNELLYEKIEAAFQESVMTKNLDETQVRSFLAELATVAAAVAWRYFNRPRYSWSGFANDREQYQRIVTDTPTETEEPQ